MYLGHNSQIVTSRTKMDAQRGENSMVLWRFWQRNWGVYVLKSRAISFVLRGLARSPSLLVNRAPGLLTVMIHKSFPDNNKNDPPFDLRGFASSKNFGAASLRSTKVCSTAAFESIRPRPRVDWGRKR